MIDPYLEALSLNRILPCLAEPGKIIVIGDPSRDLDLVMPYLASLPSVLAYNPEACTLTFRRRPGFLTLQSEKVTIIQVEDIDEGLALLEALKEAINTTWEHRHELEPVQTRRRVPRPLDIWPLLPQTNCGHCGEATCMAFAFALLQGRLDLAACQPLQSEAGYTEQRQALAALV
jgi:ArsR family metal-binding transcriptional regulator